MILVIEDDREFRDIIFDILSDEGFATHAAANGAEAMKLLEQQDYSLVITDYSMPGMNGAEITKIIRSRRPGAFIIGMSGEDNGSAFMDAGVDLYMPKPIAFGKLIEIIGARQKKA